MEGAKEKRFCALSARLLDTTTDRLAQALRKLGEMSWGKLASESLIHRLSQSQPQANNEAQRDNADYVSESLSQLPPSLSPPRVRTHIHTVHIH